MMFALPGFCPTSFQIKLNTSRQTFFSIFVYIFMCFVFLDLDSNRYKIRCFGLFNENFFLTKGSSLNLLVSLILLFFSLKSLNSRLLYIGKLTLKNHV